MEPITNRLGKMGASKRPWNALLMQSHVGPCLAMMGLSMVKRADPRTQTKRTILGPIFSERYPPGIWVTK